MEFRPISAELSGPAHQSWSVRVHPVQCQEADVVSPAQKKQKHCTGGIMMSYLKYKMKKLHTWFIYATHLLDPL